MVESISSKALTIAASFDALASQRDDELDARYGYPVMRLSRSTEHTVVNFAELYLKGGVYPVERLVGATERAVDYRLQVLLNWIPPATMNALYFDRVTASQALAGSASMRLLVASIYQDMIVKGRVTWERIMMLVHYLETGSPDLPRSSKRSAKSKFFDFCRDTPRWKWLSAYESAIELHDETWRTPELHKRSTLRARLLRGDDLVADANSVIRLEGEAMNQVWDNVCSLVGGGGVVSLGAVHMTNGSGDIDDSINPFDEWGWTPDR